MLVLDSLTVSDLAKALRAALAERGVELRHAKAHAAVAALLSFRDPNAMAAALEQRPFVLPDLAAIGIGREEVFVSKASLLEQLARFVRHEAKRMRLHKRQCGGDGLLVMAILSAATYLSTLPVAKKSIQVGKLALRFPETPELVDGMVVLDAVWYGDARPGEPWGANRQPHSFAAAAAAERSLRVARFDGAKEAARLCGRLTEAELAGVWADVLVGVGYCRGRHVRTDDSEYANLIGLLDARAELFDDPEAGRPLRGEDWLSDAAAADHEYHRTPTSGPGIEASDVCEDDPDYRSGLGARWRGPEDYFRQQAGFEWGMTDHCTELCATVVQAAFMLGEACVRFPGGEIVPGQRLRWFEGGPVHGRAAFRAAS